MSIMKTAFKAYDAAAMDMEGSSDKKMFSIGQMAEKHEKAVHNSFAKTITDSISKVNEMQNQKSEMIMSFASGDNQNVHELMVTLQKAGLAMQMTSAVRGKVMESYKKLMQMQF